MRLWIVQKINNHISREVGLVHIVHWRCLRLKMGMRCPAKDVYKMERKNVLTNLLPKSSEAVTRTEKHESHSPTKDLAPRHRMGSVCEASTLFFHQLCRFLQGLDEAERKKKNANRCQRLPMRVQQLDTYIMTTNDDENVVSLFK